MNKSKKKMILYKNNKQFYKQVIEKDQKANLIKKNLLVIKDK
jgi:hypothetical protein